MPIYNAVRMDQYTFHIDQTGRRSGLRLAPAPSRCSVEVKSPWLNRLQAALRSASGGSVACMLARASIRPSQAFSLVPAMIFAPSGVAAR